MDKCPKCGAEKHHDGVFVCGTQVEPAMPWTGDRCRINQEKNKYTALEAKYRRAIKCLQAIEFPSGDYYFCPECQHGPEEHAPDCELAAILAEAEETK